MRVVAGSLGGRKLVSPAGEDTRPTSERVREAMFNALFSLDAIDGSRVLDLFAGSGALGIEALSRGAAHATFVEQDRAALAALRENVETLRIASQTTVIAGDGLRHLETMGDYDLILLDPPYGFDGWSALLSSIESGTVVIESDRAVDPPFGWVVHRVKRYGGTVVTLATASPRGEEAA